MDKLARLFVLRLQQDARRKIKRHALMNGLLSLKIVEWEGCLVRRYAPAFDLSVLSGDPDTDISLIRKRFASFLKEPPKPHEQGATDMQDAARDPMPQLSSPLTWGRVIPGNGSASSGVTQLRARYDAAGPRTDTDRGRAHRDYAVRIVGEAGAHPVSGDMIAALLLARAIGQARLSLARVVDLVRSPATVIAIQSAVSGLEPHLVRLLEYNQLLPGDAITFADASITTPDGSIDLECAEGRRPVVHFDRYSTKHMSGTALTRRLVRALGRDIPVLATSEYPMRLADVVRIGADLILAVAKVDKSVITDLTSLFHGEAGPVALAALPDDFDPRGLSMDDLLLAFRPGRSPAETMRVLTNLAALNKPTQDDEKDDDDGSGDVNDAASKSVTDGNGDGAGDESSWSAKPKGDHKKPTDRSSLRRDKPSGAEVMQPTPIDRAVDAAANAKAPVTVEALSGYGRAKDWALGLKADLADYLSGELAWADMSTKLLLSGPPGTGKTTFARALCNTLQVPLVVTSVSTWLEGPYLNDVITRMSKTFEEARELSPSILFIDEIDGIGKRQSPEKEHADYWNTLVNKALELLDGAVKVEGVIVVGATNRPEQIDEALRRSGRLETHLEIPRPDIETLVGILVHHLGDDVDHLLTEDLNSRGPAPTQLEAGAGPEMPHAIANDDPRADANEAVLDAGSHKRGIGQ